MEKEKQEQWLKCKKCGSYQVYATENYDGKRYCADCGYVNYIEEEDNANRI